MFFNHIKSGWQASLMGGMELPTGFQPETETLNLEVSDFNGSEDFIIMKALEKPHINVLWIGTLVMIAGFIIAVRRRYVEFMQMRDKGVE